MFKALLQMNERQHLIALLKELEYREKYDRFRSYYFPAKGDDDLSNPHGTWSRHLYQKHLDFFAGGAKYKQRLYSASNRCGKTTTGAFEVVCHMLNEYPHWWQGYRFTKPINVWCVGQSSETVQKILQTTLLGEVGEFGTGMVPRNSLDFDTLPAATKMGVTVSGFKVKCASGGYSTCSFKSQEQGVLAFVGSAIDVAFCDEPLKLDIYNELITRLAVSNGLLIITSTPILGLDPMLLNFCDGEFRFGEINKFRAVYNCTFDDIPHLSQETKEQLLSSYPEYQRKCRAEGLPMLGQGAVFPFNADQITCNDFDVPENWLRICGVDVGWRATARVDLALNPNDKMLYVTDYYKMGELTAKEHYLNWQEREWIPIAIDPASKGRSQLDGEALMDLYKGFGLNMIAADNARESSIMALNEYMRSGKLKFFKAGARDLVTELLSCSRDSNGKIKDQSAQHGLDALRYGFVTRDEAIVKSNIRRAAYNQPVSRAW